MKPLSARASRRAGVALMGILFCFGWGLDAGAQTNRWTGSVSGSWEDTDWSLGVLPGTNQTILFTNAGWKALGITATTSRIYPQTLNVDSITIASPTDSFNTLLLNYAGFVTLLTANSLTVGSNSAVVMDSSALQVAGNLSVGGTFTEDNFSQVTAAWTVDVGANGPGIFNLNSGTLAAGSVSVGFRFPSQFLQQGGTNTAGNLRVYADSEYDLNDGELATWIYVRAGGSFHLRGGTFRTTSTGSHIDGSFLQSGGTFDGALMFPPDEGPWGTPHQPGVIGAGLQTGGTNRASPLRVGFFRMSSAAPYTAPLPSGGGSYTLSNGVLVTSETVIAPCGGLQQWGGTHVINGTLSVRGSIEYYHGVANRVYSAGYGLGTGTLLPRAISIGVAASLTQSAGTNQVSEAITLSGSENPGPGDRYPGTYQLAGGLLTTSNLILNVRSAFSQTGGQLTIRNLQLDNGSFSQSGGQLVVSNIQFTGGVFSQSGGAFTHSGVLALAGGTWSVPDGQTQQLGQLQVLEASTLELGSVGRGATTILRLQDSRDVPWSGATLSIVNWNSTTGLGTGHIFVGTNAQGLTSDQLSRVTFVRPNGSSPDYSAAMMPNGEVVPGAVHDYNYTTTNGTITITGYTGTGGDVTIPGTINNLPVTGIGNAAFASCTSLTSVTMGNNVSLIGRFAFSGCTNLTRVTMGNRVTTVLDWVFDSCTSLTNVTLGDSVTNIGDGAFIRCARLTSITIPDSVTSLGGWAFSFCTSLTNATIGNNVTSIGERTFSSCASLSSITIPNRVTNIGNFAFSSCSSLTNVAIGDSVTTIGSSAFSDCTSLTSLTIPDGVTSIGSYAFYSCTYLTSVTLGNSVTSIGDQAFRDCTSLSAIDVDALNSAYSSVDGVVLDKSTNTLILCPQGKRGSYAVPSSVTTIRSSAFSSCTSLTGLAIPNSVTSIEERAFWHCTGLTSLTIPDRLTSIGDYAFSSCSSLAKVTIGNAVTGIGDAAFSSCTSLANVTIGNGVTSIGDGVFTGCSSLASISIGCSVATISGSAFSGCSSLTALAVDPLNSFYSSEDGVLFNKSRTMLIKCPWGKAGSYTIPDSVTAIGYEAFAFCYGLTNVTIPNSVTSIGNFAFYYCGSLNSVTMGNGVTSIGGFVFAYCDSLNAVYFRGAAPSFGEVLDYPVNANNATVYYLPGTTGWGPTFAGRPTAPWVLPNPVILDFGPSFGLQTNRFGFIISWATNIPVVIEACTDLAHGPWLPVSTNALPDGWSYFSDPHWADYPSRFYRLRSP